MQLEREIKTQIFIHIMEYYSAFKKKYILHMLNVDEP